MPLLLEGSCYLLESNYLFKISCLLLKGWPSSLILALFDHVSSVFIMCSLSPFQSSNFHMLQAFTIICWVYCSICAETSSRGVSCKHFRDVSNILCWFCPYVMCCRGSAIKLCQLLKQRGCCFEHSLDQLKHHCLGSCYSSFDRPSYWFCCTG